MCDFKASKQSTSSSEMDFRKIAWRSSLVTSRWTSYVFSPYFCEPFSRSFRGVTATCTLKNSVPFEPGDFDVDFVWLFYMFWSQPWHLGLALKTKWNPNRDYRGGYCTLWRHLRGGGAHVLREGHMGNALSMCFLPCQVSGRVASVATQV